MERLAKIQERSSTHKSHSSTSPKSRKRSFAGDPTGRGSRSATDAAPADVDPNADHRCRRKASRDELGTTPQPRVTPGILPCALRASLRLFQIAPGDFGWHRGDHMPPLRRCGTDRGQHRSREGPWMALLWEQGRTYRHPRHLRPLREARCAGTSALPTGGACRPLRQRDTS